MSIKKNLVKAVSSTTGTGTLTLSPMTGWAQFSDAFANGDVVPYAIENGNNKEVGLGTVGASNTLARTTVLATLVAGTYNASSPTAITLSGASTVISGPIAELFTASEIAGLGTAATANTGTSGHTLPYLDGSNTFGNGQTVSIAGSSAFGPTVALYNNSSAPAVADQVGVAAFSGNNSAATKLDYVQVVGNIINKTSGSEAGSLGVATLVAGSNGFRFKIGAGLYSQNATGGDKGTDTINASAVYDDNVLLTCYAIEAYRTGTVTAEYWDTTVLDREIPAEPERAETRPVTAKVSRLQRVREGNQFVQRMVDADEPVYDLLPVVDAAGKPVKDADGKPMIERVQRTEKVVIAPAKPARIEALTHAPAARFAARAAEMLDPAQYGQSWKTTGHLPAMPSPAEWEAAGRKMPLGDIQQRLWETVEVQAIHIDKLLARIEALEARATALGG